MRHVLSALVQNVPGVRALRLAKDPIGRRNNLVTSEHTDQLIDLGKPLKQRLPLSLGQATGHDQAPNRAASLHLNHLGDYAVRLSSGIANESTGVDHDEIDPLRLGVEPIPLEPQQTGHPLGIDQILRATKAN